MATQYPLEAVEKSTVWKYLRKPVLQLSGPTQPIASLRKDFGAIRAACAGMAILCEL